MNTENDRSRSLAASRFGKLSKNMFFTRHVPHPRYLKFITGTAGVQVCHVRDNVPHVSTQSPVDLAQAVISDPRFNVEFPPNTYNETLLRAYADRVQLRKRRERFLPPLPGWNPSGTVVEDTENWRRELTRMAEMVGLVTSEELDEIQLKKEPVKLQRSNSSVTKSPMKTSTMKTAFGEYSERTGRYNETPRPLTRSRSLTRRTPLAAIVPSHLFCVDEQEREMWLLQVLCQILQTDDVNEVRSWLVSSTPAEKEMIRQLISSAIKGLEEGGRIHPTAFLDDGSKPNPLNSENSFPVPSNKSVAGSVSSQPIVSASLTAFQEQIMKTPMRPQTAPQMPNPNEHSNKMARPLPNNLESIEEKTEVTNNNMKLSGLQPTKIDVKRDIQVLTLNDDVPNHSLGKKISVHEQVPF